MAVQAKYGIFFRISPADSVNEASKVMEDRNRVTRASHIVRMSEFMRLL